MRKSLCIQESCAIPNTQCVRQMQAFLVKQQTADYYVTRTCPLPLLNIWLTLFYHAGNIRTCKINIRHYVPFLAESLMTSFRTLFGFNTYNFTIDNFHIRTAHLDVIKVLFIHSPTDALVSCLKKQY